MREGTEVQARSADDDWRAIPLGDFLDPLIRKDHEARDVEGLGEWNFTDQMMRNACPRRCVGFSRQKVEAPIDLKGIGADDLTVKALGQGDREIGLSDGGRAGEIDWGGCRTYGAHGTNRSATIVA